MILRFGTAFVIYFLINSPIFAQKIGYVDTKFVLSKMPEYREAQAEIDKLSKDWQKEIETMHKIIESKYRELKAEEVLLTDELREERVREIQKLEEEVKAYQTEIFGFEGLFFLKKKELMKPAQDKVYEAVEKVCRDHRLGILFDKSGDLVMLYTNPIHDYTDYVLEELGLGDPNDIIR